METLKDFKPSALALVDTLLSIDPDKRGTATAALQSDVSNTSIEYVLSFASLKHV